MFEPLSLLLLLSLAALVWAIVGLGRDDGKGDPERRKHWRIASVVALAFLIGLAGGMAVGPDLL